MSAAAPQIVEFSSPDMVSNLRLAKQDAVRRVLGDDRLPTVVPASRLSVRPRPLTVSTGIAELDALAGGLPRGALTEVVGPASSGRSSVLLSVLAAATAREEVCALVDTDDAFDPQSAAAAGVDLKRVLWVRCGEQVSRFDFQVSSRRAEDDDGPSDEQASRSSFLVSRQEQQCPPQNRISKLETRKLKLVSDEKRGTRNKKLFFHERKREFRRIEQALKSADLLLQSGGFGVIVIDLADVPPRLASRIPLASWFRFRRAVENTPAVLLVLEQEPFAKSCASLVVKLKSRSTHLWPTFPGLENRETWRTHVRSVAKQQTVGTWESASESPPAHTNLLTGIQVTAEVTHDRTERKPVRSITANFQSKAAWAG